MGGFDQSQYGCVKLYPNVGVSSGVPISGGGCVQLVSSVVVV